MMHPTMMPPGFSAPHQQYSNASPFFGGLDPTAAPPPHLPGSMGAQDALRARQQAAANGPIQHRFSPYEDNGGTTIGISGKDFAILGSDTRLSRGYSILSRDQPKCIRLTDKCVLVSAGMKADRDNLHKMLKTRLVMYEHQHGKPMSTPAIAQMLSNTLYHRRFFPIYAFNVLGGLDEKGQGAIYTYDAIGSFERVFYSASGSGQSLTMPILDNQVGLHNQLDKTEPFQCPGVVPIREDLEKGEALELMKDAFTSAGERDIYTGDHVDLWCITADGIDYERFDLKRD
jgi:20S proteasome subunit beta 6